MLTVPNLGNLRQEIVSMEAHSHAHDDAYNRQFSQLVARAWADDAFKRRLLDEPKAVLAEAGIEIPEGVQVRVMEDTNNIQHLVLPAGPTEGEMSEEQLAAVGAGMPGGTSMMCHSWICGGGGCHLDPMDYPR
jgi:hypothetical protein